MTGCWRCGRCGGLVQGRTGLRHGQVYGTHCNTPGPCVTPARKCNARAGGAPTRAGGGTGGATNAHTSEASHWAPTGGRYTPTPATVTAHHTEHARDTGGRYAHAGPNPEPGAPMPTPASPVCLVLGRLPSPWPIRLWAPTGGTWGQQYARAGRRSQCVTHTQHRGRSDTLTPAQVPAGGKHAHTSKKSVACADTLGLPAAVSSEDPRICDFALPRRDSNQRPCAGSNFRLHR